MQRSFIVPHDVEATRDRFVREFVQRRGGSVGLETNTAGHVDARRRFALAIQGWEKNEWIRPFLTRLEGHFERSPQNDYTQVVFVTRGLTLPLTVVSLLIPYYIIRAVVPSWEGVEPALSDIAVVIISVLVVPTIWLMFFFVERKTHKLLIDALLAAYDRPSLHE